MALYETFELIQQGASITPQQQRQLEKKLVADPFDVSARTILVGSYNKRVLRDSKLRERKLSHLIWFIDNEPEHDIFSSIVPILRDSDGRQAFMEVREHWKNALKRCSSKATVFANAAGFCLHVDKVFAEKCFLKAKKLEPTNNKWPRELSSLYRLWGAGREKRALSECKHAILLKERGNDFYEVSMLPELEYFAGNYDSVVSVSEKLLAIARKKRKDWNSGNAINDAHTFLGLVALNRGNLSLAKRHLLESAIDAASPQTQSFGPNKLLAAALLDAGESLAVMEYWEQCTTFWKSGRNRIEDWRQKIQSGVNPFWNLLPRNREFLDRIENPRMFYNNGRFKTAKAEAEKLIALSVLQKENVRHYGFALHVANTVLGQLALKAGDVKYAKDCLVKSALVPDSERLVEHGPDLSLCADLARVGETRAAKKFLHQINPYWSVLLPDIEPTQFIELARSGCMSADILW